MDESELNSSLASPLAISPNGSPNSSPGGASPADVEQGRSAVKDVKGQLIEDRVRAYVVFGFHGKDMTLQLEGKLGAEGGKFPFHPVCRQTRLRSVPHGLVSRPAAHTCG